MLASMLFFGVVVPIISASVLVTQQQVDRGDGAGDARGERRTAYQLGYLSSDYILYRESQQVGRWWSKYATLEQDLSGLAVDTPEQQVLVATLKASQQRLKEVFDTVVSGKEQRTATGGSASDTEYSQVSWSRLAVQK